MIPRWQKNMKKTISMILAAAMAMSLAACGPGNHSDGSISKEEGVTSIPPAAISNQQEEFTKKIVPLDYGPGEAVNGSPYYREGVGDDGPYYEFQVEGDEEPTRVPVSQCVVYTVEDPADCKVSKVVFDYESQGQEAQRIEQYRIFSTATASVSVNGEDQSPGIHNIQADPADAAIVAGGESTADPGNAPDVSGAADPAA